MRAPCSRDNEQVGLAYASLVLLGWSAVAGAQTPIADIKVTGNQQLPAQAIAAASGLRPGQPITPKDLDTAVSRLFETGLLRSVQYRYDPGPNGFTVTFVVVEDPPGLSVELDIPGIDEDKLWAELQRVNPLVRRTIPENENATAYYRRAIENAVGKLGHPQPLAGKVEGDLVTGNLSLIFRPVNAPKVTGFRFEGNRALEAAAIEPVMATVAGGQDYSERQFRKMLDLNLRPLYEERGYLTVKFTEVTLDSVGVVNVRIDEGPQWQLGTVELRGEAIPVQQMLQAAKFPEGQLANWKQIAASLHEAEQILRSQGYLRVQSRPQRRFREGAPIVDLSVEIQRGPRFVFGELRISGFSDAMRQRALSLWKLKPGEPMNEPYVAEYLRAVGDTGIPFQTVNLNVEPRPGTNVVDVEIDFR
jgi:outer membrane protein insertion porin family